MIKHPVGARHLFFAYDPEVLGEHIFKYFDGIIRECIGPALQHLLNFFVFFWYELYNEFGCNAIEIFCQHRHGNVFSYHQVMNKRQGRYQVGLYTIVKGGAFPVIETNSGRGVGNIQSQRQYVLYFILLYFLGQPLNTTVV